MSDDNTGSDRGFCPHPSHSPAHADCAEHAHRCPLDPEAAEPTRGVGTQTDLISDDLLLELCLVVNREMYAAYSHFIIANTLARSGTRENNFLVKLSITFFREGLTNLAEKSRGEEGRHRESARQVLRHLSDRCLAARMADVARPPDSCQATSWEAVGAWQQLEQWVGQNLEKVRSMAETEGDIVEQMLRQMLEKQVEMVKVVDKMADRVFGRDRRQ